ncbi:hypothetical protein D3C85_1040930 [compost metagenome]
MKAMKQPNGSNDFPVAKLFNTVLLTMVDFVRRAEVLGLPEDSELHNLNRNYVLIVDELEKMYGGNPKLAEISPEPFWRQFDILKPHSWMIIKYLDNSEHNQGQAHIARIERLCIITNSEAPEFSSEQRELLNSAFEAIAEYRQMLDDASLDIDEKMEDSWYINEYRLDYETNGTVVVNGVLKLKSAHIGSTIDQLLQQAFENEGFLFIPKLPQTTRNLSTVLSSAGFTPTLRQLFFPTVSSKQMLFRSTITFTQASSENIETTELDLLLKALGASLSFSG